MSKTPLTKINPYSDINLGATDFNAISGIEETDYTALAQGPYNTPPRPIDYNAMNDPYSTNLPGGVKPTQRSNDLFGGTQSRQAFMNLGTPLNLESTYAAPATIIEKEGNALTSGINAIAGVVEAGIGAKNQKDKENPLEKKEEY